MYRFAGSLEIPPGVTLRGSFTTVPSHDLRGHKQKLDDGTVLQPTGGRGSEDGTPFVTVHANGALSSLVVHYAEQETTKTPVPYPWTAYLDGANAAVTDVELLGAWNGINATGAHRHYIARVQGQPLNIGVFVDATCLQRESNTHLRVLHALPAHPETGRSHRAAGTTSGGSKTCTSTRGSPASTRSSSTSWCTAAPLCSAGRTGSAPSESRAGPRPRPRASPARAPQSVRSARAAC
jgi:hypothetical protein